MALIFYSLRQTPRRMVAEERSRRVQPHLQSWCPWCPAALLAQAPQSATDFPGRLQPFLRLPLSGGASDDEAFAHCQRDGCVETASPVGLACVSRTESGTSRATCCAGTLACHHADVSCSGVRRVSAG